MHERRVQGPGGHWATQQLVSNVSLSEAEAAKILARMPVHTPTPTVSPQVAPSLRIPAAGAPAPRPTDGHPTKDFGENASRRPAEPERKPDPGPAPEAAEIPEAARASSPPSPASPPTCAASPGACMTN